MNENSSSMCSSSIRREKACPPCLTPSPPTGLFCTLQSGAILQNRKTTFSWHFLEISTKAQGTSPAASSLPLWSSTFSYPSQLLRSCDTYRLWWENCQGKEIRKLPCLPSFPDWQLSDFLSLAIFSPKSVLHDLSETKHQKNLGSQIPCDVSSDCHPQRWVIGSIHIL